MHVYPLFTRVQSFNGFPTVAFIPLSYVLKKPSSCTVVPVTDRLVPQVYTETPGSFLNNLMVLKVKPLTLSLPSLFLHLS